MLRNTWPLSFMGRESILSPAFSAVLLLLHGEGLDASTTMTDSGPLTLSPAAVVGNAQIDTAQFKFGSASILFDGNGDYIRYASHARWLLSGPFTLECFVRFNSVAAGMAIMSRWGGSGDQCWTWQWTPTGNLLRFIYTTDGDTDQVISGSWTPSTGVWYHIAVCRDAADNVRIFVDGSQIGSTAAGVGGFHDNANQLTIGAQEGSASSFSVFHNGWLDEVRLTSAARYTSNFTPPIAAFPNS